MRRSPSNLLDAAASTSVHSSSGILARTRAHLLTRGNRGCVSACRLAGLSPPQLMPYESRVGNRFRLGRFNPSCPPGQRDDVAARFKRVEPISEAADVLDALGEISRLVVSARRSVAGRVSQRSRADIWRRANFAEHGS
jgi:hypothetical protein